MASSLLALYFLSSLYALYTSVLFSLLALLTLVKELCAESYGYYSLSLSSGGPSLLALVGSQAPDLGGAACTRWSAHPCLRHMGMHALVRPTLRRDCDSRLRAQGIVRSEPPRSVLVSCK